MLSQIRNLLDWVIMRLAIFLGAIAIAVMMFAGTFDALGRSFLNRPLWGAAEIVEFAMALTTFLSIPAISRTRTHVVIDLLDPVLKPLHRVQLVFADLLGAAVFTLMTWRVWVQGARAADYGDLTQVFHLPVSLIYKSVAVMAAMAVVAFLLNIIEDLFGNPGEGPRAEVDSVTTGAGL